MSKPSNPTGDRRANDRRDTAPDRRATSNDRRRNTDVRTPIIHITHSTLRVLVHVARAREQGDVAIIRNIPWRKNVESLHAPTGEAELTEALVKLASDERLSGAAAHILLSSELCVTRAVTGASEEVQRESALLRERSQLYLSLGPGKKLIATSSTPLDARHSHALLTVATEQTLRKVANAVAAAGMELTAIGSAQVALARAVQESDRDAKHAALVIGVDESRVELGVANQGRLFLEYRPGGGVVVDDLADLLGQHHTRLQRYCQRHHGLQGDKLSRAVVSGTLAEANRAAASVQGINNMQAEVLDVAKLALPWELRGEELGPEMAPVIGAAIALANNDQQFPNLVDQLVSKVRTPIRQLLLRKSAPLVAALVVGVIFAILNFRVGSEVATIKEQLDLLGPRAARASILRLELMAGDAEIKQLQRLDNDLTQPPLSLMVRNLSQSIPGEVWLSGIRLEDNNIATVAGSSFSESSIYDLVGHLQHVPGVEQVALQGTGVGRTANRNATTFDIHLDLNFSGHSAQESKEAL